MKSLKRTRSLGSTRSRVCKYRSRSVFQ